MFCCEYISSKRYSKIPEKHQRLFTYFAISFIPSESFPNCISAGFPTNHEGTFGIFLSITVHVFYHSNSFRHCHYSALHSLPHLAYKLVSKGNSM